MVSEVSRLVGLDGNAKMSKSWERHIPQGQPDEIRKKVMSAVTDPARIRKTDPGHPEICTIFAYHRAFNAEEVPGIETACRAGEVGCVACKKNLANKLEALLEPIRERRKEFQRPGSSKRYSGREPEGRWKPAGRPWRRYGSRCRSTT